MSDEFTFAEIPKSMLWRDALTRIETVKAHVIEINNEICQLTCLKNNTKYELSDALRLVWDELHKAGNDIRIREEVNNGDE